VGQWPTCEVVLIIAPVFDPAAGRLFAVGLEKVLKKTFSCGPAQTMFRPGKDGRKGGGAPGPLRPKVHPQCFRVLGGGGGAGGPAIVTVIFTVSVHFSEGAPGPRLYFRKPIYDLTNKVSFLIGRFSGS